MTERMQLLDEIRRCFSIWSSDLKLNRKVNRLSDNITSEDIAAGLLNLIYGYNLRNVDEIYPNQKAIDLVDADAENGGGVAVQISISNTRPKALKTMKGFCDASAGDPLCDEYSKLIFLILTVDDKFSSWEKLSAEDYTLEILNLTDLSNKIEHMELDPLKKILDYLNRHLQIETAAAVQPRDRIAPIARVLDRDAVQAAAREMSQEDLDKFCMVDISFPVMLRVVSGGRDVPHEQMNERLLELCRSGKPVILTGQSGTGKSTIMLRTAVSWAKGGDIALWLSPDENLTLTDAEAAQFYQDILSIIPVGRRALLCIDSPSLWPGAFAALGKNWPGESRLQLLMTERANRLSRMTDANNDLLHHWFDGTTVAAMMYENKKNPLRIKDYPVEYVPEDYLRRQKILKNAVSVMFRMGQIRSVSENDAVRQIMSDYGKGSVSLVELIYRAQFWLKDFATKPENLRMDWDEWKTILRKELGIRRSSQQLYGVIALSYSFEVPINISLFCRFFGIEEYHLISTIKKYRMDSNIGPVIYQENAEVLLPKSNVITELFFLFHRDILPVNQLMTELLNTMDTLEIEDFLEQIVQKGPIQKGYQFPVGKILYRDYLTAIHRRFQNGDLPLFSAARTRLALGLLYTVPKKDRRMGELTLPLVEGLAPGLDGSVLTSSFYTEWGRLLADLNQKTAAEDKFRAVLQADSKNIHSRTELGRLLAKQPGRESEAEQFFREILILRPKNILSRTELGRLLAKQPGRESEAEHFLREAIHIDPSHIPSCTELGRLLAKQPGRESEAEHFLREAMQIDPRHIQSRTELGRLLAKQPGRESEAEQLLREIIQLDPQNIHARIELGRLLSTLGRWNEAELLYREVVKIDPGNMYARAGQAKLHEKLQNANAESAPLIPDISPSHVSTEDSDETHLSVLDLEVQDPDEPFAAEPDDLSELKIIFLGDGEAGKTLTIARLLNGGEIPKDFDGSTTPGIAISEMSYEISSHHVKANIWDFGGQEILHSMHRMFLTGRTLYVIVLNAREDNMDNRAKYWLQNLRSFANNSPALLVINKIDGNSKAAVNEPELRKIYPQLGNIIKMSALKYTADEFNRTFTDALYGLISNFHSSRTPLPPEWRQLKMRIQNAEADIISNADFLQYCQECGIEDDPEKRKLILELFQDLGVCFSFGDGKKDSHIVLSPKWITNAIYMILFNDHSDLDNGILSRDSIVKLLCARDDNAKSIYSILPDMTYQPEDVDYVLDVIRKYSLSYPLDNDEEFIPMLCDRNTPAIVEEYYTDPTVLEFRVEYDYLPSNMVHNLMVRMQAQLATDIVWYSGAKFVDKKANCTAIVRNSSHSLEIYIRPETDKALPFVYLHQFLEAIEQLNIDLSLSSRKQVIAYKADGKTQYFDFTYLVKGLARGTTTVYSEQHDKSVPVSQILNPNSTCDPDRQALITNIISICRNLQRNKRYWGWDENGMNCYMREMLEMKSYVVRDQTLAGTGITGSSDGELDLDIRKNADQPWTIVEAMWIKKSANKANWNKHLTKLLIDYNRFGLPFLIQVCYVNCERRAFEALSRTHINHLRDFAPDKYFIHNSIPIETVPFGYEPNNLMFGAECTYVIEKGDSISRTTVCHIFVFIGDDAS